LKKKRKRKRRRRRRRRNEGEDWSGGDDVWRTIRGPGRIGGKKQHFSDAFAPRARVRRRLRR